MSNIFCIVDGCTKPTTTAAVCEWHLHNPSTPNQTADWLDQLVDKHTRALTKSTDGHGDEITDFDTRLMDVFGLTQAMRAEFAAQANAYGGCTLCYGKGYSTVRRGETYHGRTHNMRNDIKFCTCDRGRQLEQLFAGEVLKSRLVELDLLEQALNDGRDIYAFKLQRLDDLMGQFQHLTSQQGKEGEAK